MLRIRSPARSLPFYINHLGLRTIFTMNTGPFTIYYLGYPLPGTNQETLQSWAEETSNIHTLTQTPGLLELYHVHGSEKPVEEGGIEMSTGNQVPNLGFGHLGFTVPDVPAAVERLRSEGVRIVKELGSVGRETVPLSQFEAERGVGVGEICEEYARFWRQIACVADPVSLSAWTVGLWAVFADDEGRMGTSLNCYRRICNKLSVSG